MCFFFRKLSERIVCRTSEWSTDPQTHRGVKCRATSEAENIEVKECQNVISSKVWQLKEVEERLRAAIKTIDIRVTPEQFRRKPM